MEFDEIVVKESPGLCRCCLSEGCYKDLGSEYPWMNDNEIYADMLLECFDISITQHNDGPNGPNRLICEVCITRLRDACNFKKQVLECEKKFIDMVARGDFKAKVLIYEPQMKAEHNVEEVNVDQVEYLEDEMDFGDDEPLKHQEPTMSTVTVEALPIRGKRGKQRKDTVKVEKLTKMAKMEEKMTSSKAATKEHTSEKLLTLEEMSEIRRKYELAKLLVIILENSTIMPFTWYCNKYTCFYCRCHFFESEKLKQHMREEHQDAKVTKIFRSLLGTYRVKLDISDISCKLCPKSMQSLEEFLDHVSEQHDMQFNKDISRCIFTFKLRDDEMSCCECGEKFRFFISLLKHVHKYHNRSGSFVCEFCGQGFVRKANVDSHIRNVHSPKDMNCDKCNKTFPNITALKTHIDKEHTQRMKCPKCPAILSSKYLKQRHLAFEHDDKSYQFRCDQCPRVFTRSSALVQHKSRVHLKEKTITCEICGFKVFNKELLRKHMVRHDSSRPYECEFCKKTFQRKMTLQLHTRIHTNDKRYMCKECGKAFVQVTSLKLHVRVHHPSAN